jgi:predicted nucleic acid-binding protein
LSVVLDNSVAVEWLIGGPRAEAAAKLIVDNFDELWAPTLFWSELTYVLGKYIHRKLITPAFRDASLRRVVDIGLQTDGASALPGGGLERSIALCDKFRLTFYDAIYLELALRRRWALATFDGPLAKAARASKVEVMPIA